ncbi:hypothetical protein J6590_005477 [Homalodisca vitripennis]|nr:hypothetical protein J6590_005477 [Homalodisca vitripennis]
MADTRRRVAIKGRIKVKLVFLDELVSEEAFWLLSKHFVAVLVVFSALREPQILDSVQILLHRPSTNF